jgi:hypothetical protein
MFHFAGSLKWMQARKGLLKNHTIPTFSQIRRTSCPLCLTCATETAEVAASIRTTPANLFFIVFMCIIEWGEHYIKFTHLAELADY